MLSLTAFVSHRRVDGALHRESRAETARAVLANRRRDARGDSLDRLWICSAPASSCNSSTISAPCFGVQSRGGNSILATVLVLVDHDDSDDHRRVARSRSVPSTKSIEHGSLALGASKTQTNFKVVLSSAKSGIFTAAILGIGQIARRSDRGVARRRRTPRGIVVRFARHDQRR
ncbi:MAG: hypothetical protein MZU97_21495 [Bacillus subtilis]|nr:hypothetical protein [Bacillus subtilis]